MMAGMYLPSAFREDRVEVNHGLIQKHPLGLLISSGAAGLLADPVPFLLNAEAGPFGTLRAHIARANPHAEALRSATECLVVFSGYDHYVTPSWYETKRETGRVVPTWNYINVQAWGRPVLQDDAAWIRRQIEALTQSQEQTRTQPWHVSDAPESFIESMAKTIIGVEIRIERLEGKWKLSQNRSAGDREGVRDGLAAEGHPMAGLISL